MQPNYCRGMSHPATFPSKTLPGARGKICLVPRTKSFLSLEKTKELILALAQGGW